MKFRWDKKYLYWGVTAFIVLVGAICVNYFFTYFGAIGELARKIWKISSSIIDGLVIAFLINPLVNWFEKNLFPRIDKRIRKYKELPSWHRILIRILAVVFSYLLLLFLLTGFVFSVIPQIKDSILNIYYMFPVYTANFIKWIEKLSVKYPDISSFIQNGIEQYSDIFETWKENQLLPWLQTSIGNVSGYVFDFFSAIKNLIIGFIVSIYVLLKKETFKGQFKKIIYAIFNVKNGNIVMKNVRMASDKFSGFIVGKIIDSFIIGLLCFIVISILKIEYPVLLSIIIGVTNIIPFFGPIIGAIPCVLLLLFINPLHSLYFLIFIIILQLLDGNVIGPKILGSSTGISGFWVIFAITIFGGLWGVPGMIIGVPLFAVIYALITSWLSISLKKKDLSSNTDDYEYLDFISNDSSEFVEKSNEEIIKIPKKKEKKPKKNKNEK